MKVLTRAKHAVKSWLDSLAESNQKQFGGKKTVAERIIPHLPPL